MADPYLDPAEDDPLYDGPDDDYIKMQLENEQKEQPKEEINPINPIIQEVNTTNQEVNPVNQEVNRINPVNTTNQQINQKEYSDYSDYTKDSGAEDSDYSDDNMTGLMLQKIFSHIFIDQFNDFEEFKEYFHKKYRSSICTNTWGENNIALHCKECSLNRNACLCTECFKKANHEGHNVSVYIHFGGTCSCDCGKKGWIKSECFCKDHKNQTRQTEKDLTEKERASIKTYLDQVFHMLSETDDPDDFDAILDHLGECLMICDPITQLVEKTVVKNWGCSFIAQHCDTSIMVFLAKINTDDYMLQEFSPAMVDGLPAIIEEANSTSKKQSEDFQELCHVLNCPIIEAYVKNYQNWPDTFIGIYQQAGDWNLYDMKDIFYQAKYVLNFKGIEKGIIRFSNLLSQYLLNFEDQNVIAPQKGDKEDDQGVKLSDIISNTILPQTILSPFAKYCDCTANLVTLYNFLSPQIDLDETIDTAPVWLSLSLHSYTSYALKYALEKDGFAAINDIFKKASEQTQVSLNTLCQTVLEMPLRFFGLQKFIPLRLYVKNRDSDTEGFPFIFGYAMGNYYCSLFALVQIIAMVMDPHEFVKSVLRVFSIDGTTNKQIAFEFISSVIFEDQLLSTDDLHIHRLYMQSKLMNEDISLNDYEYYLDFLDQRDSLRQFSTTIIKNERESYLHIKDETGFSYLSPWLSSTDLLQILTKHVSKKDTEFPQKFSSEYLQKIKDRSLKLITEKDYLGLLADELTSETSIINVYNLMIFDLASNFIPDVKEFLLNNNQQVFNAIKNIGKIGENILQKYNLNVDSTQDVDPDKLKKSEAAKRKKAEIMKKMQAEQNKFMEHQDIKEDPKKETEETLCPICQLDDPKAIFCYPVSVSFGPYLEGAYGIRFISCMHKIHFKCAKNVFQNMDTQCPLDRTHYNAVLPIIDAKTKITSDIKKSIDDFFYSVCEPNQILTGLCNEVSTLDVRQRRNKNAISSYLQGPLLKLFYFIYTKNKPKEADKRCKLVFYQELLYMAQKKTSIEKSIKHTLSHDKNIDPKTLYIMLRRAAIFKRLVLEESIVPKGSDPQNNDWEQLLSIPNLIQLFGVKIAIPTTIVLDKYTFPFTLPKTILDFYFDERIKHNIASEEQWSISLITGEKCQPQDEEEFRRLNILGFVPFITISGNYISSTMVYSLATSTPLKTIYTNKYGEEDIGLETGEMLYLNEKRYNELTDQYLEAKYIVYSD